MSGKSQKGHWESLFHDIMNILRESGIIGTLGDSASQGLRAPHSGLGRSPSWKHRGPEMRLEFWFWHLRAPKPVIWERWLNLPKTQFPHLSTHSLIPSSSCCAPDTILSFREMIIKETEKNPCVHQTRGLTQQKYTASYSNFLSVKEGNQKWGPRIRNCVCGRMNFR